MALMDENLLLFSPQFTEQKDYWANKLGGELPDTRLALTEENAHSRGLPAAKASREMFIPPSLSSRMLELSKTSDLSIYMILTALLKLLIFRYTGSEDLSVISPLYTPKKSEATLNNRVIIRDTLHGGMSFKELLLAVRQSTLEAYENQDYPFAKLVEYIFDLPEPGERPVISEVLCALANIHDTVAEVVEELGDSLKAAFLFVRDGQEIKANLRYDPGSYEPAWIQRLTGHWLSLTEQALADLNTLITDFSLLSEPEREQLLFDFNGAVVAETGYSSLPQLFARQVQKTPHRIAAVFNQQQLSYGALQDRSGGLAGQLTRQGVKQNDIVGLLAVPSLEMLVGVWGILQAGGAYLPLDPEYPRERLKYLLEDCAARRLVAPGHRRDLAELTTPAGQITAWETDASYAAATQTAAVKSAPGTLAYVIYTSGSTGKPKGVPVDHAPVLNLIFAQQRAFGINEKDRILQFSSLSFDASVEQIFLALASGAALILVEKDLLLDIPGFTRFIFRQHLTHIHAVPSFLKTIKVQRYPSLKRIIAGGDLCPPELAKDWCGLCRFYNEYGPTETTVTSIEALIRQAGDFSSPLPLGKPLDNTAVYLLDRWLGLVPLGVVGELYIGGAGVTRGYLNNPELTAEKFCLRRPGGALFKKTAPPGPPGKNFFLDPSPLTKKPGRRGPSLTLTANTNTNTNTLYKTGDLGRWLPEGNLLFLGRIDHQVKIRGFRIELGEIEKQLLRHEGIKEAVVTVKKDDSGDGYLCAYLVKRQEKPLPDLREYLAERLPHYMIPLYFLELLRLPLTAVGKIDRRALPDPVMIKAHTYKAPGDEVEHKLARLWAEVLGIEKESIGIYDNFFQLGGHSLKATILAAKLYRAFDLKVPLTILFKHPLLHDLARYIKDTAKQDFVFIPQVERKEYYELSSAQKRLFFFDQFENIGISYNVPILLTLKGKPDIARYKKVFTQLLRRHETLRTSFAWVKDRPVQRVHEVEALDFAIPYDEKGNRAKGSVIEDKETIMEIIRRFVRPFALSRAPLFRVELVTLPGEAYMLLFDIHHILTDGTSNEILTAEFSRLYQDERLSPLQVQYKDFSTWQNRFFTGPSFRKQEAYWLKTFSTWREIPPLRLPTDYPRPDTFSFGGKSLEFILEKEESRALKQLLAGGEATLFMVLLAGLNILLQKYGGNSDIVVGTGVMGRPHPDLMPVVGLFVNMLALRNFPGEEKIIKSFLGEVKENCLNAFENQDVQFEMLIDTLKIERNPSRGPLFDVSLVVQNFERSKSAGETAASPGITPHTYEYQTNYYDLSFFAVEVNEEIHFQLVYSTSLFKPETVKRMARHYLEILKQVGRHPGLPIKDLTLTHDLGVLTSSIGDNEHTEFEF